MLKYSAYFFAPSRSLSLSLKDSPSLFSEETVASESELRRQVNLKPTVTILMKQTYFSEEPLG